MLFLTHIPCKDSCSFLHSYSLRLPSIYFLESRIINIIYVMLSLAPEKVTNKNLRTNESEFLTTTCR